MNYAYFNHLLKGQNAQRQQQLQQTLQSLSLKAIVALRTQWHYTAELNSARSQTHVGFPKRGQPVEVESDRAERDRKGVVDDWFSLLNIAPYQKITRSSLLTCLKMPLSCLLF
jgi:hypothetical protein